MCVVEVVIVRCYTDERAEKLEDDVRWSKENKCVGLVKPRYAVLVLRSSIALSDYHYY